MNPMQSDVAEFHLAMNQLIGDPAKPELADHQLRIDLIEEEAKELCDAIRANDLIEAIDGACDLLYVVFGTFVAAGIDLTPFFAEVHKSNLEKADGPIREDGKRLKPPNWTPPDLKGVLMRYVAENNHPNMPMSETTVRRIEPGSID